MEINIREEDVGKEYLKALESVLNIRKERRLMYGDSFLSDDYSLLFNIIDGKRNRFECLIKQENKGIPIYHKKCDEIIDIINYYLFILTKLQVQT